MQGPLNGLLVIDMTRVLAGPYCSMVLSDLGARIIKIEPPNGDDSREFGPMINNTSAYFSSLNRGKESIKLNLKTKNDKVILQKLLNHADVLIENFRPGIMKKLGFDYKLLSKKHPNLIYASCSGFGQTGPLADKPAYDMIVQGMGGLMSLTGHEKQAPVRVGTSIGDITAGLFTVIGILAALVKKDSKGQMIDISMLDCQIAILENAIARYFATGKSPPPSGARHPAIAPFECYRCKDGYFVMACGNDAMFKRMCTAINYNNLIKDKRFISNPKRIQNVIALTNELEKIFIKNKIKYWLNIFEQSNIPAGPLNNVEEAVNSEQIKHRNMIVKIRDKNLENFFISGNPIKMSSYKDPSYRKKSPELDEHRNKILKEFNIQLNTKTSG